MTPVSTKTHEIPDGSVVYDDGLLACSPTQLFQTPANGGNTNLIDLTPLPSHSAASSGTWLQEYGLSTGKRIGYGLSPREGLMVVVYLRESRQGIETEAQFKSLSPTDHSVVPHPPILGTDSVTTRFKNTTAGSPRAKVHTCGDNIAIQLSLNNGLEQTLWIICWVSGTTLILMDGIYDARFLAPRKSVDRILES